MTILLGNFRNRKLIECVLAGLALASSGYVRGNQSASVFIDSQASEEYQEKSRIVDGQEYETYHFLEGRFFGGSKLDKSLVEMEFQDIVENLRRELRYRNYYPAGSFEKGDLLIVVHWGSTDEPYDPEDPQNNIGFGDEEEVDPLSIDEGGFDLVSSMLDRQSTFDYEHSLSGGMSAEDKAMLGFDRALKAKGMTLAEEHRILSQVNTERYFMILMAFDWQKKIKEGKSELLWTTRFSMESVGTNFNASLPALTRAAKAYYGTHLNRMVNEKTYFGEEEIVIGDLEVLGTVSEEEGEAKE